jgi:hypothetical protein
MRRLRDFQPVRITSGLRSIDAFVLAVAHGQATLVVDEEQAMRVNGLQGEVTLSFQHDGHPTALEGRAVGLPDGLVYFLTDDRVAQPEPRRHPRLPITLEAELTPEEGGEPITTATRDISEGGVRVKATGLEGTYRIELRIPGSQVPLMLTGTVRRADDRGTAFAFDALSTQDAGRLRDIVMTVRRGVVRAR